MFTYDVYVYIYICLHLMKANYSKTFRSPKTPDKTVCEMNVFFWVYY